MHVWPLQEEKAHLSNVVKLCVESPQVISLRGVEKVIMLTMEDYEKLLEKKGSFISFMQNSPLKGMDLDFERDPSLPGILVYDLLTGHQRYFRRESSIPQSSCDKRTSQSSPSD